MMQVRSRFAVLGDPIEHSLSPAIFTVAFRHLGIAATYERRLIPANRERLLSRCLTEIAASGGGNVTLPHKRAAAGLVDLLLPDAIRTGAVNTFWTDDSGRLAGDNTDVGGFLAAVGSFERLSLDGASVLVLGAGAAARAVVTGCADAGAARLHVLNRTAVRAEEMVAELSPGVRLRTIRGDQALDVEYDLVVNATSLGLRASDPLPLRLEEVSAQYALDLVYGPAGTAWTAHADRLGMAAQDGITMLVRQAILSLDRWFDVDVATPGLAEAMEQAARTTGAATGA